MFFTSPNGVTHFLNGIDITSLETKKIACLGTGTASSLIKNNISPDFIGNDSVDEVGRKFRQLVKEDYVLFPGAQEGKRSIQKLLSSDQVINVSTYKTTLKQIELKERYTFILFTSPSNVRAFFNSGNNIHGSQLAIAIGESTNLELISQGVKPVIAKGYLEKDWLKATIKN